MTKRKAEESIDSGVESKRQNISQNISTHIEPFNERLFTPNYLDELTQAYSESKPYKHGVISNLVSPELLRNVRSEIQENLSFTPKETDIYKIHQSGDLANLDGLDDSALVLLPSLLKLRNALYSEPFRKHLSTITGSGPLSGKKTDMAINVYTPGCHLLCHDDVIGSRRVSYILYLTDPDRPWQAEWGGALRLYSTVSQKCSDGSISKVPSADPEVSIPPAFNQLSFFAVQPGESYHDVQEIYAPEGGDAAGAEMRVRTAISGWYHIPQEGEDGFVQGLEESLAEKSSLRQLEGKAVEFDQPKTNFQTPIVPNSSFSSSDQKTSTPTLQEDVILSEEDLTFLIKYIAPTYLTPDTLEAVSRVFTDQWMLSLDTFLTDKFAQSLRDFIEIQEPQALPVAVADIEKATPWTVARPPHKHRFLFQQLRAQSPADARSQSPLQDLLENLLPSLHFYKWLQLATGQKITSHNLSARRFRRGKDYTLATGFDEDPRLEITLVITPSSGWEPVEVEATDDHVAGDVGETSKDSAGTRAEDHIGKPNDHHIEPEEKSAEVGTRVEDHIGKPNDHHIGKPEKPAEAGTRVEDHIGKPPNDHHGKSEKPVEPEEKPVEPKRKFIEPDHLNNRDVAQAELGQAELSEAVEKNVGEENKSVEADNLVAKDDVGEKGVRAGGSEVAIPGDVSKSEDLVDTGAVKPVSNGEGEAEITPFEAKSAAVGDVSESKEDSVDVAKGDAGEKEEQTDEADKRLTDDDETKEDHSIELGHDEEAKRETAGDEVEGDDVEVSDGAPGGDVGGYLVYMADDDNAEFGNPDEKVQDHGVDPASNMSPSVGPPASQGQDESKPDPAVYQSFGPGAEVLFSMPACWNQLGIILRDKGCLRFVKYVSQQAKGDRWDICGEYTIVDEDEEGEGEEGEDEEGEDEEGEGEDDEGEAGESEEGEGPVSAGRMYDSDETTEHEEMSTTDDD
ncbi:hypothetical protein MMC07_002503 [Pseudocyphellaria aurata]|nr:hypothetical protein [Pseudocyphellaria aurata]